VCSIYRVFECATWLARWRSDYPDSERARGFDAYAVGGLGKGPEWPKTVDEIEAAFRGKPPPTPRAKTPVARATRITNFFSDHYVHAIPFDRRFLGDAWSDCRGKPEVTRSCQDARARWNEHLERFEMLKASQRRADDGG
jgi:hypothetical protein